MKLEQILDGKAIRLDFNTTGMSRETIYYWNAESKEIDFLSITSNGYTSTGKIHSDDSLLITEFRQINPSGEGSDSKASWELNSNDQLIAKIIDKGGHTIIYNRVSDASKGDK